MESPIENRVGQPAEQKADTYLGQLFEGPAKGAWAIILFFIGVGFALKPGDGKVFVWVTALVILLVLLLVTAFQKERKAARNRGK